MRQEHPESRIELQHNRPTLSILGIEAGNGPASMPRMLSVGRLC